VPLVKEVIKQGNTRYHNKIEGHVNVLIQPLLQPHNQRRLKKKKIGHPTYKKVKEELFLDNILHVVLNKSNLVYRTYVILIAKKGIATENCLPFRCLAMTACTQFTISAFSQLFLTLLLAIRITQIL
jgi:hypothetical protein